MPGIVTHHVFGQETHRELASLIGAGDREREAFLLGNQGPDPLFYLVVSPLTRRYRKLGSAMHGKMTAELLFSLHGQFIARPPSSRIARAYGLGFLCHYLLDSTVHPLVYAQQLAICGEGISGMQGRRAARAVHATIETELDEYVMTSRLGVTVAEFVPHKATLRCSPADLTDISRRMASTVYGVFGKPTPDALFKTAVHLNRVGQAALDSKGTGLRQRFDYLRPTGLASAYVLSLSHKNEPRPRTPFANDEHIPWPHPTQAGAVFSESFDELYDRAHRRALELVPVFADENFTLAQCRLLANGVNFSGRPYPNVQ